MLCEAKLLLSQGMNIGYAIHSSIAWKANILDIAYFHILLSITMGPGEIRESMFVRQAKINIPDNPPK